MKSLFFFLVFSLTVISVNASNNPLKNIDTLNIDLANKTTELVISTKGVKKLEDIDVLDFHKNTYLKIMLKVKRAKKIC